MACAKKFVAIWGPATELQQDEVSIEFELQAKNFLVKRAHGFLFAQSDAIWCCWTWSTLIQVVAWCLTAPCHYPNLCWLILSEILWHSPEFHSKYSKYLSLISGHIFYLRTSLATVLAKTVLRSLAASIFRLGLIEFFWKLYTGKWLQCKWTLEPFSFVWYRSQIYIFKFWVTSPAILMWLSQNVLWQFKVMECPVLRPGMGVQIWKKLIMEADFWYFTWWKASRK